MRSEIVVYGDVGLRAECRGCAWNAAIGETSAGVRSGTARAGRDRDKWVLGVLISERWMLFVHWGNLGCRRNHRLLLHTSGTAVSMRRVIPTRILWFVGTPCLDFLVEGCMGLVTATTSTSSQAPAA